MIIYFLSDCGQGTLKRQQSYQKQISDSGCGVSSAPGWDHFPRGPK